MGCRPSKTSPTGIQDHTTPKKKMQTTRGLSHKERTTNSKQQLKGHKPGNISTNTYGKQQTAFRKSNDEPNVLDNFPDPKKVPIIDYIPKKEKPYIKVEDTFWRKKRELIPDYSVMEKIDMHALNAPDSLRTAPEKLMKYLLKPCKTEVEKLRVLIRWIGDNIAYDVQGRYDTSKADCTVEGVLKNKKAICEGYATVVQMFCRLADIEAEKISGQTKNGQHLEQEIRVVPVSDHAWNRVKINDDWYLVDSTWCAGGVGNNVFKKEWNEWWFLPNPEAFVETHLPMANDKTIITAQQMVEKPHHSSEYWDTKVERRPAAFTFGIEPITHPRRNITTKQNEIIIKYQCKEKLSHFAHMYVIKGNTKEELESVWYILYEIDGVIVTHVRFPKTGVYHLKFGADVISGSDLIKGPLIGLRYRIAFEGKGASPYPAASSSQLGLKANFYNSGMQLVYPRLPVTSTATGSTAVKVKLPTTGILSNIVSFYGSRANKSDGNTDLRGLVYGEKNGDVVTFYIQCPEKGEYKLEISLKSKPGDLYYPAMVLLISCTNVNFPLYHHPSKGNLTTTLAGPNSHFYNVGLTTNQRSSTIAFVDDMAELVIKKTKPATLLVSVESTCRVNTADLLKKIENQKEVKITVKRPNIPGYYWLEVYAKEGIKAGSMPYAGAFCLPNKVI